MAAPQPPTTLPSTGDPKLDAALQQFMAAGGAQGVDTTSIYANPSSYADPTAPVYEGSYTPVYAPGQIQQGGSWWKGFASGPEVAGPAIPGKGSPQTKTTTVNDLLQNFYTMSPDDLARTQRLLFAGGFYGNSVHLTDIAFGVPDEASFAAWARAVSRSARLYGAGQQVTVNDVLSQAARAGGVGPQGTKSNDKIVSLTDPASLRQTIDNTAQTILGRKANVDEERVFVSLVHQMQSAAQLTAQSANDAQNTTGPPVTYDVSTDASGRPDVSLGSLQAGQTPTAQAGTTIYATQPDAQAQAEEYLRNQNPEEAGGHDMAMQFFNFVKALRGPLGG